MALTKTTEDDKIEIVSEYKAVHIRTATVVKEDGTEISRTYHRRVLQVGTLDASDNLVDTDISGQDAGVQAICNAVWTSSVKEAYRVTQVGIRSSSL